MARKTQDIAPISAKILAKHPKIDPATKNCGNAIRFSAAC
jgi:hypothetical protein